jgi:hypothetical protein
MRAKAETSGALPLVVNADETGLRLAYGEERGNVSGCCGGPALLTRAAPSRGTLTNLVFVCNDSAVQLRLPQLILGNEHVLPRSALAELAAEVPDAVHVIRDKSGWMTVPLFVYALQRLARAIKELGETRPVILLLDCSRVHLHDRVWTEARRHNIGICIIPSCVTWLMQPCDTHVFRRYKAWIRREFGREQVSRASHHLQVQVLLRIVFAAKREVLEANSWDIAFSRDGYGREPQYISGRFRKALGVREFNNVCSDFGAEDLGRILPRRSSVLERYMQHWFPRGAARGEAFPAAASAPAAPEPEAEILPPPSADKPLPPPCASGAASLPRLVAAPLPRCPSWTPRASPLPPDPETLQRPPPQRL